MSSSAPPTLQPPPANIIQAFQHFACLYIKYMQIFKRLEECYDCMVHPQKREDVLVMLACHRLTPSAWPGDGLWFDGDVSEAEEAAVEGRAPRLLR